MLNDIYGINNHLNIRIKIIIFKQNCTIICNFFRTGRVSTNDRSHMVLIKH